MDKPSLIRWCAEKRGRQLWLAQRLGVTKQALHSYLSNDMALPRRWQEQLPEIMADFKLAELIMRGDIARSQATRDKDHKD